MARDLHNLGTLYDSKGEMDKALDYYEKSMQKDKEAKDSTQLATTMNNIGVIYQRKEELFKALEYFLKALEHAMRQNDLHNVGVSLNNIGDVYYDANDYKLSLDFQFKALHIEREIQDKEGIAYSYNAIAKAYTEIKKLDSAEYFAKQALQINQELQFNPQINENYETLKSIFSKKGDLRKALVYSDSMIALSNRLFSEDKNRIINQLQQKYELDKKQSEIESLQKDNIIKQQQIENQNLWRNIWTASFGIALAFIMVLFYSNWQRLRANKRLNAKNEALKNLNATKDKLFSIISHDLRSPFNTLKSILELMREKAFSPKEIEVVSSQMQQNVESISYTLDNLLQWSLSQMKGENTNMEKVNLNESMIEIINFYREVAKQKNVQLFNTLTTTIFVYADKNQLSLILRNLVNNAIKFSFPQGTIKISASVKNKEVEISISDAGIGMNEEQQRNLFSPSNRSTQGTSGEKGTGLGLLLSKEFVENNNGKISVQSKIGQGTTIIFSLKLA
jgi:signal transduction histidine kinase